MWCRFAIFAICCIGATKCLSEKGGEYDGGGSKNQGSQSPLLTERNFGREGQSGIDKISTESLGVRGSFNENSSHNSQRNYHDHRDVSTTQHNTEVNAPKNNGRRPDYGEEHSSGRPAGQQNNRESSHHYSTEQSFRPAGESIHNRPVRPTDRPVKTSTDDRGGNKRPDSGNEPFPSRPMESSFYGQSNENGHLTSRPTQQSSHTSNLGFRPDNVGEHSSGRPTEELSATTNHKGNKRPGAARPNNEMFQSNRPAGGHSPVEHQPSEPTTGIKEQSGTSNNKESGNDKQDDGKEEDKDVCFSNLGCFKMGKPWKSVLRPIGAPHSPEKIETTVHFYSRDNLERQKNITLYPRVNMGEARFDPNKITAIIVHGFSNSGNATWMKDMKNVYLRKVDANVMIVDWGKGAQLLNYLQVAGNTRVVGKQLGLFVKYLKENYGADPGKFHLIGHSLGAQICSYLAKDVPGMARLTALDPAQPGFEGFDSELRLDKTDAEFVDVIHTDARPFIPTLGFGMITPHGHVDFYMNGGFDQPGCIPPPKKELPSIKSFLDFAKYPVEVIAKTVACPHGRAYEYLIEAFNETEKCIFWGHKADVKNVFKSVTNTVTQGLLKKFTALSTTCSKEDCIPLGFATKKSPLRGVFVITTASRSPYCISEPGIPPEMPPQERKQESFIQKIGKKTGLLG